MTDKGHELTDAKLAEIEKRISKEYRQAVQDVQEKLDDYLRRFEIKDEKWRLMVANGEKTEAEYAQWRTGQIMVGKRWAELRETLSVDLHNYNLLARSMVDGYMPEVYALNHNYATFQIEKDGRVDTSYTLYDRQTVERIMRDDPDLLPPPGLNMRNRIAAGKDIAWQEGQIQSVTMQSILQGESIPNMAKRIARTMGESNHASSIRYARTAVTGAQNAGRQDAYKRAENMGIKLKKEWLATLDNRTRHEHRILDGQKVGVDEPFKVDGYEIMYPGDPEAEGFLIWNCRCTTVAVVDGWEDISGQLRSYEAIGDMSYDEWLEAKPTSNPITQQEEIREAMRRSYISELYSEGRKAYNSNGHTPQLIGVDSSRSVSGAKDVGDCVSYDELKQHFSTSFGIDIDDSVIPLHFEAVKTALSGVEAGLNRFPQLQGHIKIVDTDSYGFMCSDGKSVSFNPKYFMPNVYKSSEAYTFQSGAHEFGHCIDYLLCSRMSATLGESADSLFARCAVSRRIVGRAVREFKAENPQYEGWSALHLRKAVSNYADDTSETLAEAVGNYIYWDRKGLSSRETVGGKLTSKIIAIIDKELGAL